MTTPPDGAWSPEEPQQVGAADELRIASRRSDGTLRPYLTIWVVRLGDAIFVRSAHGLENPWYVRAVASGTGRIQAGGVERDVQLSPAGDADEAAIDAAYHTKYDRYGAKIVNTVVGPRAAPTTLRLIPEP